MTSIALITILQQVQLFRQNPVSGWILIMRSLNWISANEGISWIKIHPLTVFCFLSYDVFLNIFEYITASKMFHITAPWHHSKYPLSCHNGFMMFSRQLGDITMDWWRCHWYQTIMWQTAWIFYTRSRKTWIFYTRSWWWENMDISSQKLNLATYHRIM